jgi:ribonuclease PH
MARRRSDGRKYDELRKVSFDLDFINFPEGSVLVSFGDTRVLCNVSIEAGVPPWMKARQVPGGWITAEYSMLPRATQTRSKREFPYPRGRTQEITRLIGRSLRAAVNLELLGERTCTIDCDVLQADGGTRTAAVTGGYVALALALGREITQGRLPKDVLLSPVAAVSAGVVNGELLLDLCYEEDATADLDANLVLTGSGEIIEFQATAERTPCSRKQLNQLLEVAEGGISELLRLQDRVLRRAR